MISRYINPSFVSWWLGMSALIGAVFVGMMGVLRPETPPIHINYGPAVFGCLILGFLFGGMVWSISDTPKMMEKPAFGFLGPWRFPVFLASFTLIIGIYFDGKTVDTWVTAFIVSLIICGAAWAMLSQRHDMAFNTFRENRRRVLAAQLSDHIGEIYVVTADNDVAEKIEQIGNLASAISRNYMTKECEEFWAGIIVGRKPFVVGSRYGFIQQLDEAVDGLLDREFNDVAVSQDIEEIGKLSKLLSSAIPIPESSN